MARALHRTTASHPFYVSLVCPLSRRRMSVPCRRVRCRHVQCFDAYTYLSLNKSTPKRSWFCPVCDRKLPVEDMRVDLLMLDILGEAQVHCDDVTLRPRPVGERGVGQGHGGRTTRTASSSRTAL
ncbi:E3 SUMO-protein ligase PIAS2-like [Haemaphysalis longicornis]